MRIQDKVVVITGGASGLGLATAHYLLQEKGARIAIFDMNVEAGQKAAAELGEERALFVQADVSDEVAIAAIMEEAQPEVVVHLAARAGVRPSLEQPLLYERTNVRGTMVLLEESRKRGVRKFIFASSSSIYGIANRIPFSEEDNFNLPISPYAATKIAGEKIAYTYSHLYGLSVVCLRFFTVYGPRQRPDLAIRLFIELIDGGRPISVFGDGSSGRDYTFVDDTVSGILAAMNFDCGFEVFNLGNSSPVNLLKLIASIEEALGRNAEVRWLPEQPGDVPITWADTSKAQRLLGYAPKVVLQEGVERQAAWHRARALEAVPSEGVR